MTDITDYPLIPAADPKPWWASKTILGGAAVVLSQAASLLGYQLDAELAVEIATSVVGLAGGVLAIWGRLTAVQPIRA